MRKKPFEVFETPGRDIMYALGPTVIILQDEHSYVTVWHNVRQRKYEVTAEFYYTPDGNNKMKVTLLSTVRSIREVIGVLMPAYKIYTN